MPRREDSFKHSDTAYNRPNQAFVCGHECDGKSCALGPDSRGACRGEFISDDGRHAGECIPAKGQYNRVSGETTNRERWFCSRDTSRGGTCKDGPRPDGSCCLQLTPCAPAASLRRKRGRATILLAALTFAFVLILFANRPDSLSHPLNPGHLSAVHSSSGTSCASCHDSRGGPLGSIGDFHGDRAFLDAHRCADCHHEIGGGGKTQLFTPHTLPREHLAKLTEKAAGRKPSATPLLISIASVLGVDNHQIACASCHKEHHGTKADLKHLSNAQCQVCHTEQFHSFSKGHPEFTAYPYRRRTRIFFDHETHFSEYFKTEEFKQYQKKTCLDCHTEQADGGMMLTASFAKTCADCHDSNTEFGSWEILAFPKIDSRRITDELGPETVERLAAFPDANAREISPLIRLLLSEDHIKALYPLRKASDDERGRAAQITRSLLSGIFSADDSQSLSQELKNSELLEGARPEDAQRLLNLGEIFNSLKSTAKAGGGAITSKTDSGGGFTYNPDAGAFSYQPGGHADPMMKAILDVAASKVDQLEHAREVFGAASDFWQGSETTGAGKCLKCHTLDQHDDGSMSINWLATSIDSSKRPITKFRHRSHIRLPELMREDDMQVNAACVSCHQLDASADHLKAYREIFSAENHNPFRFRSGFKHVMLENCAQCHTENRAGDSCLQCHQYHATPSPLTHALGSLISTDDNSDNKVDTDGQEVAKPNEGDEGEGAALIPSGSEDEGGSLIPSGGEEESGSLIPGDDEEDGDSLIPDGDGGDEDGDSLIPGGNEEDGAALLPDADGDGESLIPAEEMPEDEGDSLLPGGEAEEPGEALVPETESLLPPGDE